MDGSGASLNNLNQFIQSSVDASFSRDDVRCNAQNRPEWRRADVITNCNNGVTDTELGDTEFYSAPENLIDLTDNGLWESRRDHDIPLINLADQKIQNVHNIPGPSPIFGAIWSPFDSSDNTHVTTDSTGAVPSQATMTPREATSSVFTSAGIHVTITDYDADRGVHPGHPNDRHITKGFETQPDSRIDRLIASVTARASPTDQLEPHDRYSDIGSDDEDSKVFRDFSSSSDRLSLTPGFDSISNSSTKLEVGKSLTPADGDRTAGSAPALSSLSGLIKRAISDKRHAHRLRLSQGEEENARLYQSDSYLPALRLQLDSQSPPGSPLHQDKHERFTLPRPARNSSGSVPSPPPKIVVRERRYEGYTQSSSRETRHEESTQSSSSYQASSDRSPERQDSVEQKTSPPISPLTKGLHCSSLSLYLPPPSISSLNKMWHRCYSGDSLSVDEHRSDSGTHGLEKSTHYDLAAKVILLGDFSVGKTSFLSTLSKAKDENGSGFCREYRPGELAEVVFKRQQKRAMIRVMDTGGQERYRSMTSSYYRGVHGCLLVFDVTREDTFNNIIVWHSDLLKYSTDQYVAAILVGTTSHPGERVISPERGLKLAESLGVPYMECSPDDASMTLGIVQRLTEKVIKFALRRSSFAIDIKPQSVVQLGEKKKKKFVCLC